MLDSPYDEASVASQATLAVAGMILTNVQVLMGVQPTRNAKAANSETFDGSQEKTEQFI